MSPSARPTAGPVLCLSAILACAGSGQGVRAPSPYEPPVATAEPERPDTVGMPRIRFARGTSSGILNDSLTQGAEKAYLLGAEKGQVMLAHAIAWNDPEHPGAVGETTVRVKSADGEELKAPGGEGSLWSGRLPATGDYIVTVRATSGPTPYTLAVQIPRRFDLSPADPTAALSGEAPSRAPVDYLIAAEQGQVLEAEVRGGDPGTQLRIYGLDDGVQLAGISERRRSFSGPVPSTQDYIVSVVPAGEGERYQLVVTLR